MNPELLKQEWLNDHPLFLVESGIVVYKGKPISADLREILRDEAKAFSESLLWKFLLSEGQKQAVADLYENAEKDKDGSVGKAVLKTLEFFNNSLNFLKK